LKTVVQCKQHAHQRYQGFTATHVPLKQTVHLPPASHIIPYFFQYPFLCTRQQKRKVLRIESIENISMLLALDNGFQACMMAPTEILANQHYETIKELLFGMDIRVELLTGSIKGKKREAILTGLLTGDVKILIGTHAVIEDTVNFSSLGLVVIDEQHRFGVAQRARLWTKNIQPPHVLVMTATPIPRTLAMTLYGDLDVSVIDELPPGRKPITTIHQFDNRRESMYRAVRKQIEEGRQVYIVYPLIKESATSITVVATII